jgi:hypothetical protein
MCTVWNVNLCGAGPSLTVITHRGGAAGSSGWRSRGLNGVAEAAASAPCMAERRVPAESLSSARKAAP